MRLFLLLGILFLSFKAFAQYGCEVKSGPNSLDDLLRSIKKLNSIDVRSSCTKKFGTSFTNYVNESLNSGIKCLMNLSGKGSAQIAEKITSLIKLKGTTIECEANGAKSTTSIATASINEANNIPSKNLYHPYLVINSDAFDFKDSNSLDKFKATIFHETIHNISYGHGEGPEIAYSCEDCCFHKDQNNKLACEVCAADYQNGADSSYLQKIISWANATGRTHSIMLDQLTYDGLIKSPGSKQLLEVLVQLENAHGQTLVNIFTSKMLLEEKIADSEIVKSIAEIEVPKKYEDFIVIAKKIARARIDFLAKGDYKLALKDYRSIDLDSLQKMFDKDEDPFKQSQIFELWLYLNDEAEYLKKAVTSDSDKSEVEDFQFKLALMNVVQTKSKKEKN